MSAVRWGKAEVAGEMCDRSEDRLPGLPGLGVGTRVVLARPAATHDNDQAALRLSLTLASQLSTLAYLRSRTGMSPAPG